MIYKLSYFSLLLFQYLQLEFKSFPLIMILFIF